MRTWRLSPIVTAWMMLLAIETLGQIALKTAGGQIGPFELDRASILLALQTPWLWLGLACYLGQFVVWMVILEKSALSAAFPTSAIVFVSVMIASRVVFGDPMGWEKVLGSAVIVTGILLLGGDEAPFPPASTGKDIDWKSE
ncbi:MAG TPA: hypothetical protein VFJ87_04030 [Rhodanobacteraceae bacterium]|jgi:drug/metabolite transporter (DMT)-like permease|nr:hypothetical protein [Rhodanobacteraceae bacterium]